MKKFLWGLSSILLALMTNATAQAQNASSAQLRAELRPLVEAETPGAWDACLPQVSMVDGVYHVSLYPGHTFSTRQKWQVLQVVSRYGACLTYFNKHVEDTAPQGEKLDSINAQMTRVTRVMGRCDTGTVRAYIRSFPQDRYVDILYWHLDWMLSTAARLEDYTRLILPSILEEAGVTPVE